MHSELTEIVTNLQRKYIKLNEIYDLTKQIEECFHRNDVYALKLIVDMRTNAMLETDKIDYERESIISALPEDKKTIITELIRGKDSNKNIFSEEPYKRMCNIYTQIKKITEKTINLDKAINLKMNNFNQSHIKRGSRY